MQRSCGGENRAEARRAAVRRQRLRAAAATTRHGELKACTVAHLERVQQCKAVPRQPEEERGGEEGGGVQASGRDRPGSNDSALQDDQAKRGRKLSSEPAKSAGRAKKLIKEQSSGPGEVPQFAMEDAEHVPPCAPCARAQQPPVALEELLAGASARLTAFWASRRSCEAGITASPSLRSCRRGGCSFRGTKASGGGGGAGRALAPAVSGQGVG